MVWYTCLEKEEEMGAGIEESKCKDRDVVKEFRGRKMYLNMRGQ